MTTERASQDYQQDLGDGLLLRWSTQDDTEKIAQLIGHSFRESANEPPNQWLMHSVHNQMSGTFPLTTPNDYALIEDTSKPEKPAIACACLWRQEWVYEGVPFTIGRPEYVASNENYRRRGLIRHIFTQLHDRSAAEGHLVQAITGIPNFYRQFGYEYVLDLEVSRVVYNSLIPPQKEGEAETCSFRDATIADIPFLAALYNEQKTINSSLYSNIPDGYWQNILQDPTRRYALKIIVDTTNIAQGYAVLATSRWSGASLTVHALAIRSQVNLPTLLPSLLRALKAYGEKTPTRHPARPTNQPFHQLALGLGANHPIYDVLGPHIAIQTEPPYAWYVRVADIPAFFKYIAPVFEQRIANSPIVGYSGEFKIDFYRGGLRAVFENGKLRSVQPWDVPIYDTNATLSSPPLVFLKLLFGYRSLDELRTMFPDVWTGAGGDIIVNTLFPKKPSNVLGLG
jgi:hypothetical protein